MSMPGVQNPHWRPWCSRNASWSGWSLPFCARPSIVRISAPSAWTASMMQDRAASPSIKIVHAPQTPCSQPTCVPVRPRSSRRKSTKSLRGSQRPSRATPFTVRRTVTASGMGDRARARERPPGEDRREVAAVVGRGVDVGVGRHELRRPPGGGVDRRVGETVALEDLLGGPEPHGHRPGAGRGEARRSAPCAVPDDQRGDRDDREVAMAPRELLECPARPRGGRRQADLDEDLVGLEARREVRDEEVPRPHDALALDRKSTRLNSSHVAISYAVFCLKKKKKKKTK